MSTNCSISIKYPDGSIKGVYCHFDGYVKYTGKMLFEFYNTFEIVDKLINHGSIYQLRHFIDSCFEFHTFDNPENCVTIFYERDKGDDLCVREYATIEQFQNNAAYEYNYIFIDNIWYLYDRLNKKYIELITLLQD